MEFAFSVLSVVCYLGLLQGVSNVVGAFYFHILTTMHGQNYIKFDLNCLYTENVHLNNLNAPVLNVLIQNIYFKFV